MVPGKIQEIGLGSVYLAAVISCLFGFPWDGKLAMPTWLPSSVSNFEIAHPYWLLFLLGFGVAHWVWPFVKERIWHQAIYAENYSAFYQQWTNLEFAAAKSDFFKYLGRAYETWKGGRVDLPVDINDFWEKAQLPAKLRSRNTLADLEGLVDLNIPYWAFADALYREVDDFLKTRATPTLLKESEVDEFHKLRQRLSYFWHDIARKVFERKVLRFQDIEDDARSDARTIKALCFLEIVLRRKIKSEKSKHDDLMELGRKLFIT